MPGFFPRYHYHCRRYLRGYYHSEQQAKVFRKQREFRRRINYIQFEARARISLRL